MNSEAAARRFKWFAAAACLILALLANEFRQGISFDSDLLSLLPSVDKDRADYLIANELADRGTRQIRLLISTPQAETGRLAATNIAKALGYDPAFEKIDSRFDPELGRERAKALVPFRAGLLSKQHRQQLENGIIEPLHQETLQAIYTPSGLSRLLAFDQDPVGLLDAFVREGFALPGKLSACDGLMCVQDGDRTWFLLRAQMSGSPFQVQNQNDAMSALDAALQHAQQSEPDLQTLRSGVLFHAHAVREQASTEMSRFGMVSILTVLALLYFCFRSFRPASLSLACIGFGFACGMLACQFLFGRIHLATLVFGTSLIGLAVDYSLHFFSDQFRKSGSWSGSEALNSVGPALRLSLTTTVLAYCALLVLPIPALRQMAVFSIAGLLGAGAFVLYVFPAFARQRADGHRPWLYAAAGTLSQSAAGLTVTQRNTGIVLIALFAGGGLLQINFQDGVTRLQSSPSHLLDQDSRTSALLGAPTDRRFILVSASTPEELLQSEEALRHSLDELIASGELGGYLATSQFVPSMAWQSKNRELQNEYVHGENGLHQKLGERLGFEIALSGTKQPAKFLSPEIAGQMPGGELLESLWMGQRGDEYRSVILLNQVLSESAIAQRVAESGAVWVDQLADISDVLTQFRVQAIRLLVVMALVMAVVLAWRYSAVRALWSLLPAVGGSLLALALLGWLNVSLSLFNILALLLLLGMGVDYAIFLREARETDQASILATGLSALTTILAFGLLSFSTTPYVQSIGQTIAPGILFVFLLAVLMRPRRIAPIKREEMVS